MVELDGPSSTNDDRVRHYVERVTPPGHVPPAYKKTALCGYKIRELVIENNGLICQKCVDASRRIQREPRSS